MKLNVKALGIAAGLVWGGCAFIFGLWASFYGPANQVVDFMGQFYLGFKAGFVGAIIGLVWGFFDAGIGAVILAWLYNIFVAKFATA